MTQGIILAAGYSSRAHTNKLLLTYAKKPLIVHAIEGMRPFVSTVFVITGHYHEEIKEVVEGMEKVVILRNEHYGEGMFSSVLLGVSHTRDDFLILPGDCPLVAKGTYEHLMKGNGKIRVPSFQGKIGHPIWIAKELKEELLGEPRTSNLKVFRDRHNYEIIKVEDAHILTDIDTQADYHLLTNAHIKGD